MPSKVGYDQVCQTNSRGVNSNDRIVNMITPASKLDPLCVNQTNTNSKNTNSKNTNSKNTNSKK